MQSPRAAFAATVLLVFLSGAVAGALAMNFGVHKGLHQVAFWTAPGKEISVHRLQRQLDLTPAQTEQLKSILNDFAHYYEDVLANGKTLPIDQGGTASTQAVGEAIADAV